MNDDSPPLDRFLRTDPRDVGCAPARETLHVYAEVRLFGFINGQSGANNPQSQGFVHLVKDGFASSDASAGNTALIDALRNGGDLLNVFGDFPTLTDPRHADAYSPLWDAQLGLWTPKAVSEGLNTRQIDENVVFNLAATRPDLLTGVDPATGKPAPYGSAGVDINCAVIGFTAQAPTANLAPPPPHSPSPARPPLPVPPTLTTPHQQRRAPTGARRLHQCGWPPPRATANRHALPPNCPEVTQRRHHLHRRLQCAALNSGVILRTGCRKL